MSALKCVLEENILFHRKKTGNVYGGGRGIVILLIPIYA